jgi:hypothetical protein
VSSPNCQAEFFVLVQSTLRSHFRRITAEASTKLKTYLRDEVNALQERDFAFQAGEHKIPFTTEDFLLSFSIPNLHFHAATAYGILRSNGVPLGKRDYLGRIRSKG